MEVRTSDGEVFVLEEALYRQSVLLRGVKEVGEGEVSLLVDAETMRRIVEFMEKHREDDVIPEDYDPLDILFTDYDKEFTQVENTFLFRLTAAANYLFMPLLLELCCKTIAEALKEKTSEEIKTYLSIPHDEHTKEEIERIWKEYRWIN